MAKYNSDNTGVKGQQVSLDDDDYYRRFLPEDLIAWVLFEAPASFTFGSVLQVYRQYGNRSLEVLKEAMELDRQRLIAAQEAKARSSKSTL
jgi:hypothetical protein